MKHKIKRGIRFVLAMTLAVAMLLTLPGFSGINLFSETVQAAEKYRVVCVGGSTTRQNYPDYLQRTLGDDYVVFNRGQDAATATYIERLDKHDGGQSWQNGIYDGMSYRCCGPYLQAIQDNPDCVIIMIGGNDAKSINWEVVQGDTGIAPAVKYEEDYRWLINTFRNLPSHPDIILATTGWAATDGGYYIMNKYVDEVVPIQKKVAADLNLKLVDINGITKGHSEYYVDDGIHYNTTGYQMLADALAPAVRELNSEAKCDLVVTGITTDKTYYAGEEAKFQVTIKNVGNAASDANVKHGVPVFVDDVCVAWCDNFMGPLQPGESKTVEMNWGPGNKATWTATAGTHTIRAYVDDSRLVSESNEDNNELSTNMTFGQKEGGSSTGTNTQATAQVGLRTLYNAPANANGNWYDDIMPLGNGNIGASVYGYVENEEILINEKTLWSGGSQEYNDNYPNYEYNGGFNNPGESLATYSQRAQNGWKQARTQLQSAVNTHSGTANYNIPGTINNLINQMKGDKTEFGSYQELGSIMMEDPNYITPEITRVWADKEHRDGADGSQSAASMFDGNTGSKYYADAAGAAYTAPFTVEWDYNAPKYIKSYNIVTGNDMPGRDPVEWKLYASTTESGDNYVLIDDRPNEYGEKGRQQTTTYWINQNGREGSYRRFRLVVTKTREDLPLQISEFEITKEGSASDYTNYSRGLNLDTAEATVSYTSNGVNYYREYFVSHPNNVMVIKLDAQNGTFDKYFRLTSEQKNKTVDTKVDADGTATITMEGQPTPQNGWKMKTGYDKAEYFAQEMKIIPTGGRAYKKSSGIEVDGATSILIVMSCGTNYKLSYSGNYTDFFTGENPMNKVHQNVANAVAKGYDTLKKEHEQDYKKLYDRVKVNIGATSVPSKTTNQLFAGYTRGNTTSEDRYLETLYYQFGRYLLIAGSREDSELPTNLQGIWADGLTPPWSADFHTNVNLQMNYWLAESTNLAETHIPTINYVKSLVTKGTKGVSNVFGTNEQGKAIRGWTIWHENNAWGNVGPANSDAFYAPECAAWMCRDIWDYYEFNQDDNYLRQNYDILKQAALFWVDTLWADSRDNTLVANPSYSPEHGPYSLGATYVQSTVWGLFDEVEQASKILGVNDSEVNEIKNAKARLSGLKIGSAGQLQEWKDDTQLDISGDNGHRHENHLYALHPGDQVVAGRSSQDDTLVEAMKNTLRTRGDGGTGWSKAWKINLWARMLDGNHAQTMVEQILKESTSMNLLDIHPPYQIDGNYGATSGMTEMLLQSQGGIIKLLPAISSKWGNGSVSGLKARGNVEVSMTWSNSKVTGAKLKTAANGDVTVSAPGLANTKITKNGNNVAVEKINNDTIKIAAKADEVYLIGEGYEAEEVTVPETTDAQQTTAEPTTKAEQPTQNNPTDTTYYAGNPIITSMFTADPSAHVWEANGKLYIYASHDIFPSRGCDLMDKYHVFSTTNMVTWKDEGEILNSSQVPWGRSEGGFMWAPDAAHENGTYYFYFPHPTGNGDEWNNTWRIGIATSNQPASGFTCAADGYVKKQDGSPYVTGIDPCIFKDDDGSYYLYTGGGAHCWVAKLQKDMQTLAEEPVEITGTLTDFHEAMWVFKRNGIYYAMYADNKTPENYMRYSTSNSPYGPWKEGGIVLEGTGCDTTHGSICEYKGHWYLFYHNCEISGNGTLRSVCIDEVFFNDDGSIRTVTQTKQGVANVDTVNPSDIADNNSSPDPSKFINTTQYPVQDATLGGGANLEGDGAAHNLHLEGTYLEWNNINGGKGGQAMMTVYYATPDGATAKVNSSGDTAGDGYFLKFDKTTGWGDYSGKAVCYIDLLPGNNNTVRITTGMGGVNITGMSISLPDQNAVETTTQAPTTPQATEAQPTNPGQQTTVAQPTEAPQESTTGAQQTGFNPAELSYTTLPCQDNPNLKLEYSIPENTVAGLLPQYLNQGNTLQLVFADPQGEGNTAQITVNGQTPENGVVTLQGTGVIKVNPTALPDNSHTVITVTTATEGAFTFVIKKGDATVPLTTQAQPTDAGQPTGGVEPTNPGQPTGGVEPTNQGQPTQVQPTGAEQTQVQPTTQGGSDTSEQSSRWQWPTDADQPTVAEPTLVQPTTQGGTDTPGQPTQVQPTDVAPTTQVQPTETGAQTTQTIENPTNVTIASEETLIGEAQKTEEKILALNNDKDPAGATFRKLRAQVKKKTKSSNKVSWKKQSGATKYIVYGGKCGTKYTRLGITTAASYTHKGLAKGTYYKYMVVAVNNDGKVLAISRLIHSATKGGKVGNAKSLKLNKKRVSLKKGKKFKIKTKQTADAKKVKIKNHRKISYESSNTKVATVSKKGVIKAKAKGKCTIYVFAQNGIYKKLTVTVR